MGELEYLNTVWYLAVNHFARVTAWAHGFMAAYAHFVGLGVLALLLLAAWWLSRYRPDPDREVAKVLWAAGGTVVAWAIAHYILKPVVAERRPYIRLHGVEVLLTKTNGFSFPSGHATIAGAVIVGLWISRHAIIAALSTVAGIFLAFGRVYVGMHYPGDVLAGLVFGGLFVGALAPLDIRWLASIDRLIRTKTPLAFLVKGERDAKVRTRTA